MPKIVFIGNRCISYFFFIINGLVGDLASYTQADVKNIKIMVDTPALNP